MDVSVRPWLGCAMMRRRIPAQAGQARGARARGQPRDAAVKRGATVAVLPEDADAIPGATVVTASRSRPVDRRARGPGRRRHVPLWRVAGRRSRRAAVRRQPRQPRVHHAVRALGDGGGRRGHGGRPPARRGAHPPRGDDPFRAGPADRRPHPQRRQRRGADAAIDRAPAGSGGAPRRRRDRDVQGGRSDRLDTDGVDRVHAGGGRPGPDARRAGDGDDADLPAHADAPAAGVPARRAPGDPQRVRRTGHADDRRTVGPHAGERRLDRGAARRSSRCASTGRRGASSGSCGRSCRGANGRVRRGRNRARGYGRRGHHRADAAQDLRVRADRRGGDRLRPRPDRGDRRDRGRQEHPGRGAGPAARRARGRRPDPDRARRGARRGDRRAARGVGGAGAPARRRPHVRGRAGGAADDRARRARAGSPGRRPRDGGRSRRRWWDRWSTSPRSTTSSR